MSQPWKLVPVAAVVAALGVLLLVPGGATQPQSASAVIDCNEPTGVIQVQIRDLDNSNNPVSQAGITVLINPDPQDDDATREYVDNGANDDSPTIGTIRENEACSSDAEDYTVSIVEFPTNFECDTIIDSQDLEVTANAVNTVELFVGNCETGATSTPTGTLTVTATVTGTVGPAATVTTNASPAAVSCSGTSIVTIQVRDAAGNPVQAGTAVQIAASMGSVSPSSGQTTDASGAAFVFFTAPANQGGTATITAVSGSASGQTTVTVNCGTAATATTAPPPTVSPGGGVISPPNTGDAGLAASSNGWTALAAVGFLVLVTIGALAIVRVRA